LIQKLGLSTGVRKEMAVEGGGEDNVFTGKVWKG
jgi:hypothetical protein